MTRAAPFRHSGLGITSFVIAMSACIPIFFVLMIDIIATMLFGEHGGSIAIILIVGALSMFLGDKSGDGTMIMIGIIMFSLFLFYVIGFVLGIAGVKQVGRKRLFAWLGAGINAVIALSIGLLMVVGYTNH
jgi:hypothetical protein